MLRTSWLYALTRKINTAPSLYLAAGAIHGCVLCEEDRPLLYMEDVGRHNAVDKIAGYMHLNGISPAGKIFYTTGRLTSEMVIKTVQMGIPILISRSGFTAWGVDLARQAGLTLIGRAKGRRFVALAGAERIVFDGDPASGRRRAAAPRPQGEPRRGRRGVKIVGVLLAGGLSRRMGGGDKALRLLGGRPLLDHVIERLRPQVEALVLNANGDPGAVRRASACRSSPTASPISPARSPASSPGSTGPPKTGPIAIRRQRRHRRAVSAARSRRAAGRGRWTRPAPNSPAPPRAARPIRSSGCGRCGCATDLRRAVVDGGIRKVDVWTARYRLATVEFPDRPVDPFFNANRPEDLDSAAALLASAETP